MPVEVLAGLVGILIDSLAKVLGFVVGLWLIGRWIKFLNLRVGGTKVKTWIAGLALSVVLWFVLF